MRISLFGSGAFAAAIVLAAACVDSQQVTNDSPALAATDATCQFTPMPDLARRYFAPADLATARTLIAQMETLFRNGDLLGATDKGFDVLALVEVVTNTGRQVGTALNGSNLTNGLLACMSVGQPALPIDFTGPLGPGGFGVRGGPTDGSGAVLSRDSLSGVGLQESTWPVVFGKRVLLYGTPNPGASFNELLVGDPYDWSTLPPSPVVNPGAVVGFCVSNPGRYRVEESHASNPHTILFLRDANSFLSCPNFDLSTDALFGPVGGSAGGFSDFGPVDAQVINLSYLSQPSTVPVGQFITPAVRIKAQGAGGTPMPEVGFVLSLVKISGNGKLQGSLRKLTGTTGIETFADLRVNQPGTYALLVTATAAGFGTVTLQSNQFVVTP